MLYISLTILNTSVNSKILGKERYKTISDKDRITFEKVLLFLVNSNEVFSFLHGICISPSF
jgi:hypothetical protein